jgi:hypothetical protein
VRLAEVAASMRLPLAAGAERLGAANLTPFHRGDPDPLRSPIDDERDAGLGDRADGRTMLVGGAVAASALSLAGAAWFAWRRRGPSSVMARAARAAHSTRGRSRTRVVTGH